MPDAEPGPGFPLLPLLLVPVIVVALLWFSAWASGWRRLAARYPWDGEGTGPRWRFVSVGFGMLWWYNRGAVVTATPRGLGIRLLPWLRAFHPPLLLPWDQLATPVAVTTILLRGVELPLVGGNDRVILRQNDYRRMRAALPPHLQL
jgi:hypothetical protein